MRASVLIELFDDTIRRQRAGYFHPDEAAQLLSDAHGFNAKAFCDRMGMAFRAGDLIVRAPDTELPRSKMDPWRSMTDIVAVSDLDAWLKSQGVRYRFPTVAGTPVAAMETEPAGSVLIQVASRRALPVRAIPYVTSWCIAPDDIAQQLAGNARKGFERLASTSAYILDRSEPRMVLPQEWDRFVAILAGMEAELNARNENDDAGFRTWLEQSAKLLPAGVFVWFDEFEKDFATAVAKGRMPNQREGGTVLITAPILSANERAMVLEGFSPVQDRSDSVPSPAVEARAPDLPPSNANRSNARTVPPRMPMMERNRQAVLVALSNVGFDPVALPRRPPGKKWPAKQAAKEGCGLSDSAFDHAWKDLSKDGRIKETPAA